MKEKRQKRMKNAFGQLEQFNRLVLLKNLQYHRLREIQKIKQEKIRRDNQEIKFKKQQANYEFRRLNIQRLCFFC